jgi:selenocysteine-specific elongation factor
VLDPLAPVRARPWPLEERTPGRLLARLLAESGAVGIRVGELPVRLGVAPAAATALAASANGWRVGERLLSRDAREALAAEARAVLSRFHDEQPLEVGAPLQWLRTRLRAPDDVATALLAELGAEGLVHIEQGHVRRSDFSPHLTARQTTLRDAMVHALAEAGREPPALDELALRLHVTPPEAATLARLLARQGTLVAVEPARYYHRAAVDDLVERLRAGMAPGTGYGPADLRELLGFSRKFLIPFLEHCDREGITQRDSAGRRRRAS